MAGKTRTRDGQGPKVKVKMDVPKGHLGLKSSAFAPTDCKLANQFIVADHMRAHYTRVNKAKCSIDNRMPKSCIISQKVRDQVRRTAIQSERREAWVITTSRTAARALSHADSSEIARNEMFAMMESMDDYDEVDNKMPHHRATTTMEVLISESGPNQSDMAIVDKIVADNKNSPSRYQGTIVTNAVEPWNRTPRPRPHSARQVYDKFANTTTLRNPSTPRSADVLEQQAHMFTEEKPFQPRINRTNRTSKLSQFKCYNAPKKTPERKSRLDQTQSLDQRTRTLKSTTPLTESLDLMNASLMSRDMNQAPTPTGVPPLDISLDTDHMQWLKEQSKLAQVRSKYHSSPDRATLPRTSQRNPGTVTLSSHINTGEEELKYLDFIRDVTNDVLDRGIFTNRVLKQVFQSHMQRRKDDLKISRMRELLDDLRRDLGITGTESDCDLGLTSTHITPTSTPHKTLSFASFPKESKTKVNKDINDLSMHDAQSMADKGLNGPLMGTFDPLMMTTKKFDMATLRQASRSAHQSKSRSPSPNTGRPPFQKRSGRLKAGSRENSLEDDFSVSLSQTFVRSEDIEDGHAGSKPDDDLSAYKLPPPASSSVFNQHHDIMPIEEQSETARTDTARTETARTDVDYHDDYEDDSEGEGAVYDSPTGRVSRSASFSPTPKSSRHGSPSPHDSPSRRSSRSFSGSPMHHGSPLRRASPTQRSSPAPRLSPTPRFSPMPRDSTTPHASPTLRASPTPQAAPMPQSSPQASLTPQASPRPSPRASPVVTPKPTPRQSKASISNIKEGSCSPVRSVPQSPVRLSAKTSPLSSARSIDTIRTEPDLDNSFKDKDDDF